MDSGFMGVAFSWYETFMRIYRCVGVATAAGAEALPEPPGALKPLIPVLFPEEGMVKIKVQNNAISEKKGYYVYAVPALS